MPTDVCDSFRRGPVSPRPAGPDNRPADPGRPGIMCRSDRGGADHGTGRGDRRGGPVPAAPDGTGGPGAGLRAAGDRPAGGPVGPWPPSTPDGRFRQAVREAPASVRYWLLQADDPEVNRILYGMAELLAGLKWDVAEGLRFGGPADRRVRRALTGPSPERVRSLPGRPSPPESALPPRPQAPGRPQQHRPGHPVHRLLRIDPADIPANEWLIARYGTVAETVLEWWKNDLDEDGRAWISKRTMERLIKLHGRGLPLEMGTVYLGDGEYAPVPLTAQLDRLAGRRATGLREIARELPPGRPGCGARPSSPPRGPTTPTWSTRPSPTPNSPSCAGTGRRSPGWWHCFRPSSAPPTWSGPRRTTSGTGWRSSPPPAGERARSRRRGRPDSNRRSRFWRPLRLPLRYGPARRATLPGHQAASR